MQRKPAVAPAANRSSHRTDGKGTEEAEPEEWDIGRVDAVVAAGVLVVAATLFLTTFSTRVALSDAPESVAGVRILGILHAPGYPAYVLAAHAFALVFPFGSWALRVNTFSLVCASLTIAAVYLIARLFGARRIGAVIGAFSLATTASFWLYAGFAKYYAFAALLLAAAVLFVTVWVERGGGTWLVLGGAALGVAFGTSWQLAGITALALAALVLLGPRLPTIRLGIVTLGVVSAVVAAVWVFVLVRARQDPTLNWGEATNLHRLWNLLARKDFRGSGSSTKSLGALLPGRVGAVSGGLLRDFGLGAVALAVVGGAACRRLGRARIAFLAGGGLVNLVSVFVVAGVNGINGFTSVLTQGGYLLLTMIVVAILIAIGASDLQNFVERSIHGSDSTTGTRTRSRILVGAVTVFLAASVLVPSVLVHRSRADLRGRAYADDYARRVLDALPQKAVLLVWGEEFGMPMIYRQIVDHYRSDVSVVSVNEVELDWGREQIKRRFGITDSLVAPSLEESVQQLVSDLSKTRPVYLDTTAMSAVDAFVGYQPEGLVGKLVSGSVSSVRIQNPDAVATSLAVADQQDGIAPSGAGNRIPFYTAYFFHSRAHIEVAKAYALQRNRSAMLRELRIAIALFPLERPPHVALDELEKNSDPIEALRVMRYL